MQHPKTLVAVTASVLMVGAILTSCSRNPVGSSPATAISPGSQMSMGNATAGGPPGYESAYVNGTTVRINAIEVNQNPTQKAQADFYEVVYPFDPVTGQELPNYWPGLPQCGPCDHQHNSIMPDDFHDHVLDSQPGNPDHGAYNALWHVYLIMLNYTASATHNADVNAALKSLLPVKSEDAVNALLATQVDGLPLANKIDTYFCFICDVVSQNAGAH